MCKSCGLSGWMKGVGGVSGGCKWRYGWNMLVVVWVGGGWDEWVV